MQVLLFDVNETLLNMQPLKQRVNDLLQNQQAFSVWFGMLLQYSLVDNCTGTYHDFQIIANAVLSMAAHIFGVTITPEQKKETLSVIKILPCHADVVEGLTLLKQAGYRLAVLTNSPTTTMHAQLEFAGINGFFEKALSIDAMQQYKPAAITYQYAAEQLGVAREQVTMVAAHGWDVAGAMAAGLQAVFIARKGQSVYTLAPKPTMVVSSVIELAEKLTQKM